MWSCPSRELFQRKDVVVGLADKEAAHVDANISANFKRLIECEHLTVEANNLTIPSIKISRLIAGRAGIELLSYLDEHFPS